MRFLSLFLVFLMVLFSCSTPIPDQKGSVTKKEKAEAKSLLVYGDEFSFGVKEPKGWEGDTERAGNFYSNIVFYKSLEDVEAGGPLVQVRLFKKKDENTIEDLKYDVESYKKDYSKVEELTLKLFHPTYDCFSSHLVIEEKANQYLTYVNPGEGYPQGFSVAMNLGNRPAQEDEFLTYKEIIASLLMIEGKEDSE